MCRVGTHNNNKGNGKDECGDEHADETDEQQCFPSGFLNHDQRDERHGHVHGTDSKRGQLRRLLREVSHAEDFGGEVHRLEKGHVNVYVSLVKMAGDLLVSEDA